MAGVHVYLAYNQTWIMSFASDASNLTFIDDSFSYFVYCQFSLATSMNLGKIMFWQDIQAFGEEE